MRNACLFIAFTLSLALAASPKGTPAAKSVPAPVTPTTTAPAQVTDTSKAPPVTAPTSVVVDTTQNQVDTTAAPAGAETLEPKAPESGATPADAAATSPVLVPASGNPLINDYGLVAREYAFGIAGQAVAGALGFFIGSAIETAIVGETEAHKGTLSFTGIRYDNFYGAFWGASIGSLIGSSLTVYFTGQSDEEDGSYFWTLVGTGLAGAGGLYAAHLMGVNDDVDWTPFIPLLALPTAGGIAGFNISRWFSDRKRERIMGPDAGLHLHAPTFGLAMTPSGERYQLQALNMSF